MAMTASIQDISRSAFCLSVMFGRPLDGCAIHARQASERFGRYSRIVLRISLATGLEIARLNADGVAVGAAGEKKKETGDRSQETGDRSWKAGDTPSCRLLIPDS
jgi:hypothetical protein